MDPCAELIGAEHDLTFLPRSVMAAKGKYSLRSLREREELAFALLASLPRSSLARVQRRIEPLLQLDVVGLLPTEVALHIFSFLSWKTLLQCALVSHRWQALSNDNSLWRRLCNGRGWLWKEPSPFNRVERLSTGILLQDETDDEGMGDEEEATETSSILEINHDSGFASMQMDEASDIFTEPTSPTSSLNQSSPRDRFPELCPPTFGQRTRTRHSTPATLLFPYQTRLRPDYKLLHQTHTRLQHRFLSGSYRLSSLQTRGTPNSHTNTIYCLQLYTYPETGTQVLFTGSKDWTIKEWNLTTGVVQRIIEGVHEGSVLSICVHNGYLASAGSDRKVAIWDLKQDKLVKVIQDHEDSVLCIRFDDKRLVSCSKDRTVRTYLFPDFAPQHVLSGHRAAVNALSISPTYIVSASGDRSMRLWNAETGALLSTFENHHNRGIASIDLDFPFVLSGSSDKHIRLFDMSTSQGWSTFQQFDAPPTSAVLSPVASSLSSADADHNDGAALPLGMCENCGGAVAVTSPDRTRVDEVARRRHQCAHGDLVRSVAMGSELVVTGSYDLCVKVWERKTGRLAGDLSGGHSGRIFCVGFDATKVRAGWVVYVPTASAVIRN
ncbi:hypothetical protein EW146_g8004 [Bondarzewia mesenterica]|uniref:F-box domain-containing protein n=1 Tax=Bondarzewia mesenterica TaxID=1095465 RepID=A0A4S4LIF1_9AGAM|nr:hypothetical protein EW146_g8004 [Bondarzewia mesenterica]